MGESDVWGFRPLHRWAGVISAGTYCWGQIRSESESD